MPSAIEIPTKAPAANTASKTGPNKKAAAAAKVSERQGAAPVAESEKHPAEAGQQKKTAGSNDKKAATVEKKRTTSGGEKRRTTSVGEKKSKTTGGEKPKSSSGDDKKPSAEGKTADANGKITAANGKTPISREENPDEPVPVYVPKLPVALPTFNTLEWASSARVLENLLNHTPSLGAALSHLRPFKSLQHLVDELNVALDTLPQTYIESILKRLTELPLIPKSKLTKEHKCCEGLEKMDEEQRSNLTPLYKEYREKFGFPFVVCARETKASELDGKVRSHLQSEKAQELERGRQEIKKIARMRLLDVVAA